jgi:ApaG protein
MNKRISMDIKVKCSVRYLPEHSNAMDNSYFFMYTITIENKSDFAVQLLSRHWDIFDSSGEKRVVDGDGVIGEQPVIEPGKKYSYTSGCGLTTDLGKMSGYYNMIRKIDQKNFIVPIPEFYLFTPYRLN